MKLIAKIIIRIIWTFTILFADAFTQTHYEYVNYTIKTNWLTLKTTRIYER